MTDVEMVAESSAKLSPTEEDLYMRMKDLESELEILQIQEDYLKDEQRHLKSEYVRSKEEVSYLSLLSYLLKIDQKNIICIFGNW
jgi:hypothetical protein